MHELSYCNSSEDNFVREAPRIKLSDKAHDLRAITSESLNTIMCIKGLLIGEKDNRINEEKREPECYSDEIDCILLIAKTLNDELHMMRDFIG